MNRRPTDALVPAQEPVVKVRGLVKSYGCRKAVRCIDLDVYRGEIFAFLGPNGAGKTTTVEILEGFQPRTAGEVNVLGVEPACVDGAWRDRVGVVLQNPGPEPSTPATTQHPVTSKKRPAWSASKTTPRPRLPSCPAVSAAASTSPWP